MKILKLLTLLTFGVLFSQCKTTTPTGPSTSGASLLEVARTLDTTDVMFIRFADSTNGNAGAALQLTSKWLQSQLNTQAVSVLDNSYLYFTLKSGLTGIYYLNEVDASGMSLVRGGKGGGGELQHWDALSLHKITNKSILLFAPVFDEFYTAVEIQRVTDRITKSGLGLNLTIKKDAECTSDVVDHFGDYGFVIIDTHGAPNGFLIGTEVNFANSEEGFKQEIDVDFGKVGYDKFQAGQIMLSRGLTFNGAQPGWQKQVAVPSSRKLGVLLTSNYVVRIPALSGTVIFGNMCYSGQGVPASPPFPGSQTPIRTAFTSLNPISYFGYSYANGNASRVSNGFAKEMEDSLLRQLITNADSTGHCHLAKDGTEYSDKEGLKTGYSNENLFFKHFGAIDYSYDNCIDTFTDDRDQQVYKAVCIGKQTWMAENLRYNAPGSFCHDDISNNCVTYGKLYDWKTIMQDSASSDKNPSGVRGICPKGWHIPSASEWTQMIDVLGGDAVAGGAMKATTLWDSPNVGATNSSGFTVLPAAGRSGTLGTYERLGYESFMWSSTSAPGDQAWLRALFSVMANAGAGALPQTDAVSCRCVKDP